MAAADKVAGGRGGKRCFYPVAAVANPNGVVAVSGRVPLAGNVAVANLVVVVGV